MHLTSASIRSAIALSQRRDAIFAQIKEIDAAIAAIATGGGHLPKPYSPGRRKARRKGKRGAVKELILAALHEAGAAGIAVKHLAAKIGAKPANVHVWFATTGRSSGLVRKIGKGVYALESAMAMQTPTQSLKAPKPRMTRKSPNSGGKTNKK